LETVFVSGSNTARRRRSNRQVGPIGQRPKEEKGLLRACLAWAAAMLPGRPTNTSPGKGGRLVRPTARKKNRPALVVLQAATAGKLLLFFFHLLAFKNI
jgi:hypothetical protein